MQRDQYSPSGTSKVHGCQKPLLHHALKGSHRLPPAYYQGRHSLNALPPSPDHPVAAHEHENEKKHQMSTTNVLQDEVLVIVARETGIAAMAKLKDVLL